MENRKTTEEIHVKEPMPTASVAEEGDGDRVCQIIRCGET